MSGLNQMNPFDLPEMSLPDKKYYEKPQQKETCENIDNGHCQVAIIYNRSIIIPDICYSICDS